MCPAQPVSRFHISVTFVTSRPTSQFVSPGQLSVGGPLLRCTNLHSKHFISNNKDYFVPKYFQHYSNNVSIRLRTLRGIYTQRSGGDQWILNTGHVTSRAGSEVSKVFTITEKASASQLHFYLPFWRLFSILSYKCLKCIFQPVTRRRL